MLNIFLTYRCNLACPYCFARGLADLYPPALGRDDFARLLAWLEAYPVGGVALLGGEPTLHPDLPMMLTALHERGIMTALFTNGLFPPALRAVLAEKATNFVVNFNDRPLLSEGQRRLFHANLAYLRRQDCRLAFAKNFSADSLDYGGLLAACARYGVRHVRYDISRPDYRQGNVYYDLEKTRTVAGTVAAFARECEVRGIRTGLDCCIPLCFFAPEDREWLQAHATKFTGICHPSLDIHPDLSVSYCLPLRGVSAADCTAFPGEGALLRHFAGLAREMRFKPRLAGCETCGHFRRRCQAGCMAL